MALSHTITLPSDEDGTPTVCGYHICSQLNVERTAAGYGVGMTYQAYVDAADFATRGLSAPIASWSDYTGSPAGALEADPFNFADTWIIAHRSGWSGATKV